MLPHDELPAPPPRLNQHRDSARANLLRANTAVAAIIGIVLVLALGAVWQSRRATRLQGTAHEQRRRAETAEAAARTELWRARLAEAKATRLGQTLDRRAATLDTLRRAAEITPTAELRNEAVATLSLPERRLESALELDASVYTHELDPTLTRVALGLTNGEVILRRLADGADLRRLSPGVATVPPEHGEVVGLSFSNDGKLLCVRHNRGALSVWELDSGRMRFVRDTDPLRHRVYPGVFSSDGRFLVAAAFTPEGFAVLDAETGRMVAHYPGIRVMYQAVMRPGTHQFAVYDGTKVTVHDWETGERPLEVSPDYTVYHLAWSPDGRWLGIFGNSLECQLRDLVTQRVLPLRGHRDAIYKVCFDPNGERLAGISYDGISRIWNLQDGGVVGHSTDARMLRWGSQDRVGWLIARKRIEVWRELPGQGYLRAPPPLTGADPQHLDLSPDGGWAASVTAGQDGLVVWPLDPPGPPRTLPLSKVQSACFDPVTSQLLVIRDLGLETFEWTAADEGGQPVFRLGRSEASMPVPRRQIDRVTCSANGQARAFINLKGGAIWLQHVTVPENIVSLEDGRHSSQAFHGGSPLGAATVALSPDGRWMVCGADGSGARVLDTETGKTVKTLNVWFGGAQFSPDGRWLVLNNSPECVLFRTSDWSEVWRQRLAAFIHQAHGSAAFSPDGSRLAYVKSATQIALVETASGRELAVLESPSGSPPTTLRWSPTGKQLVALTREHSLDVWQPEGLQRELAGLGLDWNTPVTPPPPVAPPVATGSPNGIALGILLTAGVVAGVALLSLRRHRRLIEDFSRTEALALSREQELQIEREVGRLKSSFVSMVSHEFRTPLGITMSAVELLQNYFDRLAPAKREELLADIHDSTRHMADLMEQVLLLGRVEAGKLGFKPAPLDLVTLVDKLTDETLSATHRKCPIEIQPVGDLDGAHGDEALLRHILGNLIANAVKYSPAGSPVGVTLAREGDLAVLTVRDHGIGIPEADLPQLFQAFQRATNVGEIPGTGLGLVIVKRCVDLHGGTIGVISQTLAENGAGSGTGFQPVSRASSPSKGIAGAGSPSDRQDACPASQAGPGTAFTVRVPLFGAPTSGVPAAPRSIAAVQNA